MISANTNLAVADEQFPAVPIGMPALCQMAFDGLDLAPVWNRLVHQVSAQPADAAALLDLSTIAQLQGRPQDRRELQSAALSMQRIYRRPAAVDVPRPLKLLAFMAPGDFMANTPLEFMLDGSSIVLDMIYVVPGTVLPEPPEHDVALVAAVESDREHAGSARNRRIDPLLAAPCRQSARPHCAPDAGGHVGASKIRAQYRHPDERAHRSRDACWHCRR